MIYNEFLFDSKMNIQSILHFFLKVFAHFFLIFGSFMMISGFIGLLKNKNQDVVSKMHFLATGESLGFLFCIIGVILYCHVSIALDIKLIIIALLFWLANAVTAYNIAKTEYVSSSENDKI